MTEYFPTPNSLGGNVKVELDLFNYATKADLKNATGVDTSDFAKKTDLANSKSVVDKLDIDKLKNVRRGLNNLKNEVDELDICKLETTTVDLSKVSNVVKNDVVKKTGYDGLVKKVNNTNILILMIQLKKLAMTQKLMKLKKKLLIMIMMNILILTNLIN